MKSVSTKLVRQIWESIAQNVDVSDRALTRFSGVYHEELLVENGRIDQQRYGKFLTFVETFELPLLFNPEDSALNSRFEYFPEMVSVLLNAPNLYEALNCFKRYRGVIGETDMMEFRFEDDVLIIEYQSDFNERLGVKSAAYNFLFIDELVSQYDSQNCALKEIRLRDKLTHEEMNAVRDAYTSTFDIGHNNTFKIDLETLYRPHLAHNSILQPHLMSRLESSYTLLQSGKSYTDRIIQLIKEYLWLNATAPQTTDKLSHWVCERLCITRWTLNRRLQQEGRCLTQLYQLVRRNEACRLLQHSQVSLVAISQQLGFANQSGFNRFFREQMQCTPLQYQKRITVYNGL